MKNTMSREKVLQIALQFKSLYESYNKKVEEDKLYTVLWEKRKVCEKYFELYDQLKHIVRYERDKYYIVKNITGLAPVICFTFLAEQTELLGKRTKIEMDWYTD